MITFESLIAKQDKVAVVGLGYVGLPLAVHLSKYFDVVGYDLKQERISELNAGNDKTLETSESELKAAKITYTSNAKDLSSCRMIIVAVPTPIDDHRIPDLKPLEGASRAVGQNMAKGSCVVFESTVYPGTTEEVCVPIIEKESGMTFGKEFTAGYSPERINPGDKVHTIEKIVKIVSGSDAATLELVAQVYGKVVHAGLHRASSIKVAEAAKVIENTQRDLNIALMNELAMIFDIMGIDTSEVLEAAGTKWNFLPFRPGLVGGHCIGVDPYYLTFKAESLGYHPDMILSGRRVNDGMGKYIAEKTVKMLIRQDKQVRNAKVAVLGITFKENVPDLRNTRVVDIVKELQDYGITVLVHDSMADAAEAKKYYGIELVSMETLSGADAVIVAVLHKAYKDMGLAEIAKLCDPKTVPLVVDVKAAFSPKEAQSLNIAYWRL
jgi:UDP-N-acetyl-D-galactosamine dehydrogenase